MAGSWSCSVSAVILIFMHCDLSGIKSFIKMINHGIQNKFNLIVTSLPSRPIAPLILDSDHEYALFEHIGRYPWVLEIYRYMDQETLLSVLGEKIIGAAEEKANALRLLGSK